MLIKLDGNYGTREYPENRVVLYCIDAPGAFPIHGRVGLELRSWRSDGVPRVYGTALELVPLQVPPKTRPSVNWDYVDDKWNYLVKNALGMLFFYSDCPTSYTQFWTGKHCVRGEIIRGIKEGTCDWKDSLVRRPA